jgi:hypothetical protein
MEKQTRRRQRLGFQLHTEWRMRGATTTPHMPEGTVTHGNSSFIALFYGS